MAARWLFWKWHRWKSIGFIPYTQVMCNWSLNLIFKAKLNLESNMATRQPFWKLHHWKSIGFDPWPQTKYMQFEIEIPKQTWVMHRKPCHLLIPDTEKSNMATGQPFWKWHWWKWIGFCPLPQRMCIWNLKLKFPNKLELRSGNHVVYRQTDGRTDRQTRLIQYTPLTTSSGRAIMIKFNQQILNLSFPH